MVEGYKCSEIITVANEGSITKYDCHYVFSTSANKTVTFTVYIKRGGKTKKVGSQKVLISEFPTPLLRIGSQKGPIIEKRNLLAQLGLIALMPAPFPCLEGAGPRVASFKVLASRNDSTLFQSSSPTAEFSPGLKQMFQMLQAGDRLLFYEVVTNTDKWAQPTEFVLVE